MTAPAHFPGARPHFPGLEHLNPAAIFAGPGYTAPLPRRSAWGRASVVLAAVGLVAFFLLPFALIAGIVGMSQTADGTTAGRSAARAGLTLSIMGTVVWLALLLATALSTT